MKNETTKTIAIINYKGGVGKTTTTLNFGSELAERGYKVLLVDFDMQGNLTKASGVVSDYGYRSVEAIQETIAASMDSIMEGSAPSLPILKTKINNNLDVVPCNIRMEATKARIQLAMARETILDRVLEFIRKDYDYDYIIIDNAASVEIDFQNSLVAANEVIVITNPDIFSTEGMTTFIKKFNEVKKLFNPNLKVAGVLINDHDGRTRFSRDMINVIKEGWGDVRIFDDAIPHTVKVMESQAMETTVKKYAKNCTAALAFEKFTDEYLKL